MNKKSEDIDWDLTTWEGSRREQLRRWSKLTLDEILAAQEEMASLADELSNNTKAKLDQSRREIASGRFTTRQAK